MKRESNQWTTTEHSSTNDFTLNRPIKVTMVISSRYHPIICNIMLLTLSITLSEGKHNGFNTLRGSIVDKYHYSFHSPISSLASSSLSSPSTWKTGTTPSSESSSKSSNSQWKPNPLSSLINVPTISSFNINHDHLGKSLGKNDSKLSAHFSTLFNSTHDNYKQPVNMLINNQSKEMSSSIGKQSSSSSSPYSSSSQQPFIRLGKRSSASESLPNHVMRDSCSDDQECLPSKTKCMVKEGLCGCSPGYMDITSSESSYVSKFCFKLKRNGEHCEHSAQCFVSHSTCERINPPILNNQSGTCQCKQGFNEQGGDEVADVNGYEIKSDRICVPVVVVVNKTYMKITVALSVLTIAALIACTFIVIKIKRNKRQAQTETAVASSMNGSQYDQGQRGQHVRDLGNPPPMGSAEAEFQNDFIQVFPMHHLEPCPEKNMTALIMQ